MTFLLLLTSLLLAGAFIARRLGAPTSIADSLNWWVLYIALPAVVLDVVPAMQFDYHLWFLVASQWLGFAVSYLVFRTLGRWWRWSPSRIGAMTLVCGLSNTAFIGFPFLDALRGPEAVALGVIADQFGAFIALSVGGPMVIALCSGDSKRPVSIGRQLLLFPGFLALLVGIVAGLAGGFPEVLAATLQRIGQTLAPLAVFSVGLRLQLRLPPGMRVATLIGLSWKLLLLPLLIWGFGLATGISGLTLTVGVLEVAMAPMFSSVILARQHRLEPELSDVMLSYGLLLSFITVPLWNLLL